MEIYTDKKGRKFIIISDDDKIALMGGKDTTKVKLIRMELTMARKHNIMGIVYPDVNKNQMPIWFYFLTPTKSISVFETEQKQKIVIGLFRWYK